MRAVRPRTPSSREPSASVCHPSTTLRPYLPGYAQALGDAARTHTVAATARLSRPNDASIIRERLRYNKPRTPSHTSRTPTNPTIAIMNG